MKGRRAGGSYIASIVALGAACLRDYRPYLAPGERAVVVVLACDRAQARVIFGYIRAALHQIPMLRRMIERETQESIDLDNGVSLEVHSSSFRSIRGRTIACAICDELAFWRSADSANPDKEIVAALRPALATIPGSLLYCVSSPYAKRGVLHEQFRKHYGQDGSDVLVWRGASLEMNPTLDPGVVTRALEEDPAAARAEYLAEFRDDVETFVSVEPLERVTVPGRLELPPVEGVSYFGFVDPSDGSSDSMTLGVAHREERDGVEAAVLDAVREARPPFSPSAVVQEFEETLKRYQLSEVTGDRYGAEWVGEQFRKASVTYKSAEKPKSDLYREFLPMVNAGTVELLEHPKLLAQLASLERRTARGGRDSIDHGPRGHDDLANAAAGALVLAVRKRGVTFEDLYPPLTPEQEAYRREQALFRPATAGPMGRRNPSRHSGIEERLC